jgi:hypothetical protein
METLRAIGKAINQVAKKNGIKITWKVKRGDLVIAVEEKNLIKMIGITNTMGFVGYADVHGEHGMATIWIKDEIKAKVVEVQS